MGLWKEANIAPFSALEKLDAGTNNTVTTQEIEDIGAILFTNTKGYETTGVVIENSGSGYTAGTYTCTEGDGNLAGTFTIHSSTGRILTAPIGTHGKLLTGPPQITLNPNDGNRAIIRFDIVMTNGEISLPDPSNTVPIRQIMCFNNSSSLTEILINGSFIPPGYASQFVWDGTGWRLSDPMSPVIVHRQGTVPPGHIDGAYDNSLIIGGISHRMGGAGSECGIVAGRNCSIMDSTSFLLAGDGSAVDTMEGGALLGSQASSMYNGYGHSMLGVYECYMEGAENNAMLGCYDCSMTEQYQSGMLGCYGNEFWTEGDGWNGAVGSEYCYIQTGSYNGFMGASGCELYDSWVGGILGSSDVWVVNSGTYFAGGANYAVILDAYAAGSMCGNRQINWGASQSAMIAGSYQELETDINDTVITGSYVKAYHSGEIARGSGYIGPSQNHFKRNANVISEFTMGCIPTTQWSDMKSHHDMGEMFVRPNQSIIGEAMIQAHGKGSKSGCGFIYIRNDNDHSNCVGDTVTVNGVSLTINLSNSTRWETMRNIYDWCQSQTSNFGSGQPWENLRFELGLYYDRPCIFVWPTEGGAAGNGTQVDLGGDQPNGFSCLDVSAGSDNATNPEGLVKVWKVTFMMKHVGGVISQLGSTNKEVLFSDTGTETWDVQVVVEDRLLTKDLPGFALQGIAGASGGGPIFQANLKIQSLTRID